MIETGEIITGKYRIVELLDEGGMSFVYKARDLKANRDVAIKFMKPKVTSTYFDDLVRFKREIAMVERLNHPGVIKIFETGEYENRPFLVMELLTGESLVELIGRQAFQTNIAVTIALKLAEILDYVHKKGIVHRDLKPGNVFINFFQGDIQLKILDFGLSLLVELKAIEGENEIAGTFGYMSPEATGILKRRIDERSDLYSLGVILYQLLTAELPFRAEDANRLIYKQIAYNPQEICRINPEIPRILDQIVMKLLAKDPDQRYQSAKGLIHDLNMFRQGQENFLLGIKDFKIKLNFQPKLIGRNRELAKLIQLFDQAVAGTGTICLISGEPGIGKSRLVEEFREYVYSRAGMFLMGRCLNHFNKNPYQPFKDVLDDYISKVEAAGELTFHSEKERLKVLMGDLGDIALRLNPSLEKLIGKAKTLVPLEPDRETQRFLMVLTKLFCRISNSGKPVIIFLDDLQWADEGSLALLQEILKEINSSSTLIVGTYRDNEIGPDHGLNRIKTVSANTKSTLTEIKLERFEPSDIDRLITAILGWDQENKTELLDFILEKSHGNPLFVINILRELVENKVIIWKNDFWEVQWEELKRLPVAESIVDLILQRVRNLTELQIDLLCKAAIIGREFDTELLFGLTQLPKEQVVICIDEFLSMLLLERSTERGHLLFAHDRIRDAFYQKLKVEERQAIHLKIAQTMEAGCQNDKEKFLFELAHHYVEGNDPIKALEYVLPAAKKAKVSYANEEAIRYYQIGLQLLTRLGLQDSNTWISVTKDLTEVYLRVGKNQKAIDLSLILLSLISEPMERALIYRKIGIAHFKIGNWQESEQNLLQTLKLLGEKLPRNKTFHLVKELLKYFAYRIFKPFRFNKIFNSCFISNCHIAIYQEIVETYYTLNWIYILTDINLLLFSLLRMVNISEAYLKGSNQTGLSYSYCSVACMSFPLVKKALRFQEQALVMRKQKDDIWGIAQSWQFFGWIYCWSGQHQKSLDSFKQAEIEFLKIGDMWEYGMALQGLVVEYYYIADYENTMKYARHYLDVSNKINNQYGYNMALLLIGLCYLEMGDYIQAEEFLHNSLQVSEKYKIWFNHCIAMAYDGILKLKAGNYDAAVDTLEKCKVLYEANWFIKDHTINVYPYLAYAGLERFKNQFKDSMRFGSESELKKIASQCREAMSYTKKWPNHFGYSLRVTASYYALVGKNRKAEAYYLKSIKHTGKINRRFECAKSYYEYGKFLRTRGRLSAAKENLSIAYEIFTEIGSKDYQEKCRVLLDVKPKNESSIELTIRDRLTTSRRWETVLATSRYISSILDINELLAKILDRAMELIGAARGVLLLYPEMGEKRLETKVFRNVTLDEAQQQKFISQSIISQLEKERRPLIITDALSDIDLGIQSSVIINKIRSVICAPIVNRGIMLGVIYLDNNLVGGLFSEDDAEVLDIITGQAGISIENALLYNRLKTYSEEIEESRNKINKWNQRLEQRVNERTEELKAKNVELNHMIEQLKEHAQMVEELAIAKERNRLAMDVHDTLGNTMSLLIKLLEASKISARGNSEKAETHIDNAIMVAREGFSELKRSIKGLVPGKLAEDTLETAIQELAKEYLAAGVKIDFKSGKITELKDKEFSFILFKICQEAITNAIRHGKAKNINIQLVIVNDKLLLSVRDDGNGCTSFIKGSGLTGIEQRVTDLNGSINFQNAAGKGFTIQVEIPIKDGNTNDSSTNR